MIPTSRDQPLWAITTYFNPMRYRRRLANYREFRRRLTVPLVAVELAYQDTSDLTGNDADVLVRLRSNCILFQKERLLNIALAHVPSGVPYVAWLDCDIVFQSPDWGKRAAKVLQDVPLIQPFSEMHHLDRNVSPADIGAHAPGAAIPSVTYKMAMDPAREDDFALPLGPVAGRRGMGFGYAARRSLLEKHAFYDVMILGGGDGAMIYAAYGKLDQAIALGQLDSRRAAHYLAWARPFYDSVQAKVGYAEGKVYHLWHGDLEHRRYYQRHAGLTKFGFDPAADLKIDEQGCWTWARENHALQAYVRGYFESRMEDGDDLA